MTNTVRRNRIDLYINIYSKNRFFYRFYFYFLLLFTSLLWLLQDRIDNVKTIKNGIAMPNDLLIKYPYSVSRNIRPYMSIFSFYHILYIGTIYEARRLFRSFSKIYSELLRSVLSLMTLLLLHFLTKVYFCLIEYSINY